MALAALAFQAGSVYSASVTIGGNREDDSSVPGAFVLLASGDDGNFTDGQYYAGVFFGTANYGGSDISTSFFCAELNNNLTPATPVTYTDSTLEFANFRNGNPVNGGSLLTMQQKCMIMGVYIALGITDPTEVKGFVKTTDEQNLLGTATPVDLDPVTPPDTAILNSPFLSHERAAAAQLVIWEIIHEPLSPIYGGKAPIIGLAGVNGGNLVWSLGAKSSTVTPVGEYPANWAGAGGIEAEFNNIAGAAYTHAINTCGLTVVPEVTSPVALIAGGLMFMRRREPRARRLKSLAVL